MFGIYPDSYRQIIKILSSCESIEEVIIYGSRAKGNYREGSDIDITLLGDVSEKDFSKLYNDLEDSYIPYLFDISIYDKLNSESLKDHIKRVGKTFYKKSVYI
ncbi:hypothetical protein CHU92_04625 [Flavobacterium cyanobacteriorum]|uniref:Polymerase beta nucleotidyltransferase domain-containing protein n=1 Tax=Flavobacterium cyanobacteriorum TaxID=2022802 RepID=A0A255ZFA5_9FLAO|nr:nucleotidyltransferase domain-containing protein [Flavobacterium cyanobacteriorum]OYQ39584.1 hypothetical protein CHU92_04625 [Flavobacterium cyanobacteriorum]